MHKYKIRYKQAQVKSNSWRFAIPAALLVALLTALFFFYPRPAQFLEVGPTKLGPEITQLESSAISNIPPLQSEIVTSIDTGSSAETIFVYNPSDSHILYAQNSERKMAIASLTKLATALVIYENYKLDDDITAIDDAPVFAGSNNLSIKKGDSFTVEDGLNLILISSYNDVAAVFEQSYDGDFIEEMNELAAKLGMHDTQFKNPSGYDRGENFSTARDLKKLTTYFMQHEDLMKIVGSKSSRIVINRASGQKSDLTITTTNRLLTSSSNIKGIKTGYTTEAGECFIGYYQGEDSKQDLVIILLNSSKRFTDTSLIYKEISLYIN